MYFSFVSFVYRRKKLYNIYIEFAKWLKENKVGYNNDAL